MFLKALFLFFVGIFVVRSQNCDPSKQASKVKNTLNQLSTKYVISEGIFYFDLNASSFLANPTSVYGLWYFPDDSIFYTQFGFNITIARASNAYILPGCTPPNSVYYSVVSYLFGRYNPQNNNSRSYETLFASLGASSNMLVFNTSDDIYDSSTIFMQTADQVTFNDVYDLFESNNMANEITLSSLPSEYVEFAPYKYNKNTINEYNGTYDTLGLLMRIAIPNDIDEYNNYIHQNQTAYMLTPIDINENDNEPKIPFQPETRNTYNSNNIDEYMEYSNVINQYKSDLIQYLTSNYSLRFKRNDTLNISPLIPPGYGFECIDENKDCLGDNRDALYWQKNDKKYEIHNNSYYIIIGVNHANLNQTTYDNVALYIGNNAITTEPGPSITNFEYNNSAYAIPLQTSIPNNYLDNIFVIQTTRIQNCLFQNGTNKLPGFCLTEKQLNYSQDISWSARNYLNPFTFTRPDIKQIIPDTIIEFLFN